MNEANKLKVAAALQHTTNTAGWGYISQLMTTIAAEAVQEALDEEDSVKGEAKRLKAKALQKGFNDLRVTIENQKSFQLQPETEAEWQEELDAFNQQPEQEDQEVEA